MSSPSPESSSIEAPLSSDATTSTVTVTSADETTSTTSADENTSTAIAKSRLKPLKPVWRSPVWDFFTICQDKKFAKCEECAEVVSRGGDNVKSFTTSNLVSHLRANHPIVYQRFCKHKDKKESQRQDFRKERMESGGFPALRQLTLKGSQDRVKQWDINDSRSTALHRKLGEMIALDYQPLSLVEDIGFVRFVAALEPRYKVPSRKYMTEIVLKKINMGMKEKLLKKLHAPGVEYYSFTTDGWSTNVASHSLLSLTAHWVEQDFTKMSAVLCVKEMEGSHTGSAICAKFVSMLSEWDIKKHNVQLVLRDNAANMEKAMRDATIPSYGCFAHSLQLVVNDGVFVQRSVNDLLAICRRIVGHFKRSTLASGKLKDIQKNLSLPQHNLKQDEPTRWNSSLYMIQSVVEQKMAIAAYGADGSIPILSASQLDIATKVINILTPIEEITRNVSAEAASISQVIPLVRALTKVLGKEVEDTGVRSMKNKMLDSLRSRFNDIEEKDFLVIATLLDPRYKDKFFSSGLSRQYGKTLLVDEYLHTKEEIEVSEPAAIRVGVVSEEEEGSSKLWGCLSEILQESNQFVSTERIFSEEDIEVTQASAPEVDQYLTAPLLDFKKGNPFKWWQDNYHYYPILAKVARRYLPSPATSVHSERLFSGAGEVYDDKRSRLAPELAESLLLIKYNFELVGKEYTYS